MIRINCPYCNADINDEEIEQTDLALISCQSCWSRLRVEAHAYLDKLPDWREILGKNLADAGNSEIHNRRYPAFRSWMKSMMDDAVNELKKRDMSRFPDPGSRASFTVQTKG